MLAAPASPWRGRRSGACCRLLHRTSSRQSLQCRGVQPRCAGPSLCATRCRGRDGPYDSHSVRSRRSGRLPFLRGRRRHDATRSRHVRQESREQKPARRWTRTGRPRQEHASPSSRTKTLTQRPGAVSWPSDLEMTQGGVEGGPTVLRPLRFFPVRKRSSCQPGAGCRR